MNKKNLKNDEVDFFKSECEKTFLECKKAFDLKDLSKREKAIPEALSKREKALDNWEKALKKKLGGK